MDIVCSAVTFIVPAIGLKVLLSRRCPVTRTPLAVWVHEPVINASASAGKGYVIESDGGQFRSFCFVSRSSPASFYEDVPSIITVVKAEMKSCVFIGVNFIVYKKEEMFKEMKDVPILFVPITEICLFLAGFRYFPDSSSAYSITFCLKKENTDLPYYIARYIRPIH